MSGNITSNYGAMLSKDFDNKMKEDLLSSQGGRLSKYVDKRKINGQSRTIGIESEGDFTDKAPYLYGTTETTKNMVGGIREMDLKPTYKYAYHQMTAEEQKSLSSDAKYGLRLGENENYITKKLRQSLEMAEDITIVKALEELEATGFLPADNVYGDDTVAITDPENITLFKRVLMMASSMYDGVANTMNVNAFMVIDNADWATILVENQGSAVFMSSDYKHMTGIDGRNVTSVFGVAVEKFNPFKAPKGDDARTAVVPKGKAWLCTYGNIAFATWEDSIETKVETQFFNRDTISFGVKKSMAAKVVDPDGVFVFKFKPQGANKI